tara:strand:+ start:1154 stop:1276 length:123 start_codon:yes stop_codon:yes gene_type:complete
MMKTPVMYVKKKKGAYEILKVILHKESVINPFQESRFTYQ